MSTDDFKARMRRGSMPPPVPPAEPMGADSNFMFSRPGTAVQRPMTPEEQQAIAQGKSPTANISEPEKRALLKMGWSEGSPVPPDIAGIFSKIVSEYKSTAVQQGAVPKEMVIRDIDDLPPQEQARVRTAVQESIAIMENNPTTTMSFSSFPPDVAAAMQGFSADALKEVSIPDWKDSIPAPPPTAQTESKPETSAVSQELPSPPGKRCVHCGGDPFEDVTKNPISRDDKYAYLLAIGMGKSFEKEYSIFGNTITVRFRSLRPGEYDTINVWASQKTKEETERMPVDFDSFLHIVRRHESLAAVVLQTTRLVSNMSGSPLIWMAPPGNSPGLKDWIAAHPDVTTLDVLIDRFCEVIGSDSMIAGLRDRLIHFNRLEHRLTTNANDTESFWQGI